MGTIAFRGFSLHASPGLSINISMDVPKYPPILRMFRQMICLPNNWVIGRLGAPAYPPKTVIVQPGSLLFKKTGLDRNGGVLSQKKFTICLDLFLVLLPLYVTK